MILRVHDLHAGYGSVRALQGTGLEVREGEIVGLVGHNGVGKSTLLKVVAGIVRPAAGEVRYDGRAVGGGARAGVREGISYVPEDRRIFHSLSVEENLRLGAAARGDRDGVRRDVERELDRFPVLRDHARTGAGNLSGGEQQMLAIARALVARPRLLLLDEPTLGLAPRIVQQIFGIVTALRADGVTVLLVEQNVAKTIAAADRTYVMGPGGRIAFEGTKADLERTPDFRRAYLRLSDTGGATG